MIEGEANNAVMQQWLTKEIDLHARLGEGDGCARELNEFVARLECQLEPFIKESVAISNEAFKLDSGVSTLIEFTSAQNAKLAEINSEAASSGADAESITGKAEDLYATADKARDISHASAVRQGEFLTEMALINGILADTSVGMAALRKESEAIRTLSDMLSDLSAQLNILAINASIEAARSGASGKGFAVIAKEMRLLQDRTGQSALSVGSKIGKIIEGIGAADDGLERARNSVARGKSSAESIGAELSEIDAINTAIDEKVGDIRSLARNQLAKNGAITAHAAELDAKGRELARKTEEIRTGAEKLHDVVDALNASLSPFRFAWHGRVATVLERIVDGIDSPSQPSGLETVFLARPYYELFYVMDAKGIQISENIQNPSSRFTASGKTARGVNRAGKEYFAQALVSNQAFFSDLYVSTATRRLCLTVSRRFERGGESYVFAGDINIDGLLNLLEERVS
jgi:methyl-accepting chemotaxis protein